MVEQCQQAGLVWGKELYFDATQVKADAALDSLTARFAVEARAYPLYAIANLRVPFTISFAIESERASYSPSLK